MQRQYLLDTIVRLLGSLQQQVVIASSLNLLNINVHCENLFRDLFNKHLGYNFSNINIDKGNAAAIDLGDTEAMIAMQITATATTAKLRKTTDAFDANGLDKFYNRLWVLNIGKETTYSIATIGKPDGIQLCTKRDVLHINDVARLIQQLPTPQLEQASQFLEAELATLNTPHISREVDTLNQLIIALTDDQEYAGKGLFLEDPDPDGKINERFASYSTFLIGLYQALYVEYGAALEQVMSNADLGHPRIVRLGLHLRTFSDSILTEQRGDAKAALEVLVVKCAERLNPNAPYDETAIRFFLVHQLIRCNVFPNPVA